MTEAHNSSSDQLPPVILVDDEADILLSARITLRSGGVSEVLTLQDGREIFTLLEERGASAIVLDLMMPQISGVELLEQLQKRFPEIPVLVMTALQEVEVAIRCMKDGAFDYLLKPVEQSRFIATVKRAQEFYSMRMQMDTLRRYLLADGPEQSGAFSEIITQSPKMRKLFSYVEAVAQSNEPVLVTGETGVGKELMARALHSLTGRRGEFVAINVAGMTGDLFADSLFGHQKGAFSSADSKRSGLVAQARGGTLFLDEIGDLQMADQVKLLRLLQESQYYPLGSDVPQQSDARVVVATNVDLKEQMQRERFRPDLFFRLSAHPIQIPPLRERKEDIPLLLTAFLQLAADEMNKPVPTAPPELVPLLQSYHYPGNVRELRAMVWDAIARHGGGVLSMARFREVVSTEAQEAAIPMVTSAAEDVESLFAQLAGPLPTIKDMERMLVEAAMERAGQNQGTAAGMLGISRPALNQRLKKLKGG
uniref:Putative Sigma-54 dependent DNA-binding response regulator n=1 Tax=Magnetococcus massalia (strain MO-1) TaxID=451514 RepID=A0A1S7LGK7_MAGMO|nr:putative Sigma-54 dependent DNA-binding response regulator [Candidatus Magnetococcus massalia]